MTDSTADYIVVGGGLTGCVVASRLSQSEQKPKVILLEAGPDPSSNPAAANFLSGLSLQGGELDHAYQSEPEPNTANRVHTLHAGRGLGGGTILNYGGWMRADASDYDDWAEMVGDKRWSYEGFKPWLRKPEKFHDAEVDAEQHGTDGPMHVYTVSASDSGARKYLLREPVKEAWAELGVTHNQRQENGSIAGLVEMCENSRDGLRQPAQEVYSLDGVVVLTNTVAQRVTFAGTTATGVELTDGRRIAANKEVILCAGSYRTPQVLMLSGVGPSATLNKLGIPIVHESPHVGQNLHDHFAAFFAFRLHDSSEGYALGSPAWQDAALFKALPWDWAVSAPLPRDIIAKHESDVTRHDRNLWEVLTVYVSPGIPGIPVDGNHIATSTMLLRPTSRGTVSVISTNPADPPRIQPNYLSTALDRDTLVHAARKTLESILTTNAFRGIVKSEVPPSGPGLDGLTPITAEVTDEELDERIRRTGTQHHHSGGTAAMGKVVDTEGKVLGVSGLRVADASIVPLPLGGHPQATLYPMADQVASFILHDA